MMKLAWWKILTILLLFYTVIAGMLFPLKPSLTGVSHTTLSKGKNHAEVYYYNSRIGQNDRLEAWLFDQRNTICAEKIHAEKKQVLKMEINVPDTFSSSSLSLVLRINGLQDTLYNAFQLDSTVTMVRQDFKNACYSTTSKTKFTGPRQWASSPEFPNRAVLNETIRNLFFHVPIWFAMILVAFMGMLHAALYLRKGEMAHDLKAEKYMKTAVLMGILGLLTGSLWARFTWGTWWVFDVKLNGAAIAVLIYVAYLVLRSGITDEIQKARTSAVYSIFAFVLMIVFVLIVPRIYDSLHPGNGGNPAFSSYDLNSTLRLVFYPAVLGWMGLALWITELSIRFQRVVNKENENI